MLDREYKRVLAGLSLLCAICCGGPVSGETPDVESASSSSNTVPAGLKIKEPLLKVSKASLYVLAPDDVVEVKVYQQADLETRGRISKEGTMTLPLLGPVAIGGKTVKQATTLIHDLLAKDYLVNPQVSLAIVEYAARFFVVLGEVQRPGVYSLPHEQSLGVLQAIAMSGGYNRLGDPGKVTVQRLEDGRKKIYRINAEAMAKDAAVKPFIILPEDTITVGQRIF